MAAETSESPVQLKAFCYWYQNGRPSDKTVAEETGFHYRTIEEWRNKFSWRKRADKLDESANEMVNRNLIYGKVDFCVGLASYIEAGILEAMQDTALMSSMVKKPADLDKLLDIRDRLAGLEKTRGRGRKGIKDDAPAPDPLGDMFRDIRGEGPND
jgi:hypothetical protein